MFFFPGGTRSRSGMIEQKLKLGLLGSALSAYSERISRGDERPIYIVPVTINYPLVLEAETSSRTTSRRKVELATSSRMMNSVGWVEWRNMLFE